MRDRVMQRQLARETSVQAPTERPLCRVQLGSSNFLFVKGHVVDLVGT